MRLCAQQSAPPDELTATPNRPSVSNPADTTQRGVFETEQGIAASSDLQEIQSLLKFGVTRDFEVRLGNNPFQHDATVHTTGAGDTTLGAKYRFLRQKEGWPSLAIAYTAKLPTANGSLGSGELDHQLTALASKDIGKSHFDFNLNWNLFGRTGRRGYDRDLAPALSWSHPLSGRLQDLQIEVELSGESSPNPAQAGSISNLYAIAYTVKPRLVLDSGVIFGLTGPVPRAQFLAGFTYAIADLYHPHRAKK